MKTENWNGQNIRFVEVKGENLSTHDDLVLAKVRHGKNAER